MGGLLPGTGPRSTAALVASGYEPACQIAVAGSTLLVGYDIEGRGRSGSRGAPRDGVPAPTGEYASAWQIDLSSILVISTRGATAGVLQRITTGPWRGQRPESRPLVCQLPMAQVSAAKRGPTHDQHLQCSLCCAQGGQRVLLGIGSSRMLQ